MGLEWEKQKHYYDHAIDFIANFFGTLDDYQGDGETIKNTLHTLQDSLIAREKIDVLTSKKYALFLKALDDRLSNYVNTYTDDDGFLLDAGLLNSARQYIDMLKNSLNILGMDRVVNEYKETLLYQLSGDYILSPNQSISDYDTIHSNSDLFSQNFVNIGEHTQYLFGDMRYTVLSGPDIIKQSNTIVRTLYRIRFDRLQYIPKLSDESVGINNDTILTTQECYFDQIHGTYFSLHSRVSPTRHSLHEGCLEYTGFTLLSAHHIKEYLKIYENEGKGLMSIRGIADYEDPQFVADLFNSFLKYLFDEHMNLSVPYQEYLSDIMEYNNLPVEQSEPIVGQRYEYTYSAIASNLQLYNELSFSDKEISVYSGPIPVSIKTLFSNIMHGSTIYEKKKVYLIQ